MRMFNWMFPEFQFTQLIHTQILSIDIALLPTLIWKLILQSTITVLQYFWTEPHDFASFERPLTGILVHTPPPPHPENGCPKVIEFRF